MGQVCGGLSSRAEGPVRWGSVEGLSLVFPWSTYTRMVTAATGPDFQGGGLNLKTEAPMQIQTPFFGSPQQNLDKLASPRGFYQTLRENMGYK